MKRPLMFLSRHGTLSRAILVTARHVTRPKASVTSRCVTSRVANATSRHGTSGKQQKRSCHGSSRHAISSSRHVTEHHGTSRCLGASRWLTGQRAVWLPARYLPASLVVGWLLASWRPGQARFPKDPPIITTNSSRHGLSWHGKMTSRHGKSWNGTK